MSTIPKLTLILADDECPSFLPLDQRMTIVRERLKHAGFDLSQPFSYEPRDSFTVFQQPVRA